MCNIIDVACLRKGLICVKCCIHQLSSCFDTCWISCIPLTVNIIQRERERAREREREREHVWCICTSATFFGRNIEERWGWGWVRPRGRSLMLISHRGQRDQTLGPHDDVFCLFLSLSLLHWGEPSGGTQVGTGIPITNNKSPKTPKQSQTQDQTPPVFYYLSTLN